MRETRFLTKMWSDEGGCEDVIVGIDERDIAAFHRAREAAVDMTSDRLEVYAIELWFGGMYFPEDGLGERYCKPLSDDIVADMGRAYDLKAQTVHVIVDGPEEVYFEGRVAGETFQSMPVTLEDLEKMVKGASA
jgi:hypothetical protein